MNLGGEPERDDFGLPPVDIEIPDDARELDRDVQAYRREQRALRRRQRRVRLHGPLTRHGRDGVLLPLLAAGLVLALIAGTLLTVFAAGPGDGLPGATTGAGRSSRSARASSTSANSPGSGLVVQTGRRLPDESVRIGGKPVSLNMLTAAVLALVPAGCGCGIAARQLIDQVAGAGLKVYVVGGSGHMPAVRRIAAPPAIVTYDPSGDLARAFPPTRLTALLVQPDGTVGVAKALAPGFDLRGSLAQLDTEADQATRDQSPAVQVSAGGQYGRSPGGSQAGSSQASAAQTHGAPATSPAPRPAATASAG